MIYGQSQFTLVREANKTKCKSRLLPDNEATTCGAQDLNSRVKIKLEDSYFVVDTTQTFNEANIGRFRPYCLETNRIVYNETDSKKSTSSIQLGDSNLLLERPYGQSFIIPENRLVSH